MIQGGETGGELLEIPSAIGISFEKLDGTFPNTSDMFPNRYHTDFARISTGFHSPFPRGIN